jgi:membrane-associated phospholipid phosphatase
MRRRSILSDGGCATGRRGLSLVLALALAGVAPAAARAEEPDRTGAGETAAAGPEAAARSAAKPPPEAPANGSSPTRDDGRRTMGRLPANLGRGFIGVFNRDNLVPLLVGGVAAAGATALDKDVRRSAEQPGFGGTLETAGGPLYSAVLVAGMFTAGRFAHGTRFRAMTYDMLDAAIVNVAYTEALKLATGRERPNGENNKSFPSGHTSNAFALAAVAERHYGWKVGVPAYALAGLVGASRLSQNKHYLSDVVAGATLGYIAGRTVVRVNNRPLPPGRHVVWTLSPILARDARGMRLTVLF